FTLAAFVPSRAWLELKRSFVPSGDHRRGNITPAWSAVSLVKGVWLDPSAVITHTLVGGFGMLKRLLPLSARAETMAVFAPSGDQTGPKVSAPPSLSFVRSVVPDPSAFITQMLSFWASRASLPSRALSDA